MWKWFNSLIGRSTPAQDGTLRTDMEEELRRVRRDGGDGSALLMVPAIGQAGQNSSDGDSDAPDASDSASGGGFDGGSCGASCGAA